MTRQVGQVHHARRSDVAGTDQTGGTAGSGAVDGLGDERAAAFHDGVERAAQGFGRRVVGGAEGTRLPRLGTVRHLVHHVDVEATLRSQEGSEEADRTGPQDQGPSPRPAHRVVEQLPGLRHHAGGLEQHTGQAQVGVHPHGVLRLEPEPFGTEPVPAEDAALGETPVLTEVELTHGTKRAGNRVGTPHDTHDEITRYGGRPGGRFQDPAQ